MRLVTDERVAFSREVKRGYVDRVREPQVVSVNGTLASEAVAAALMFAGGRPPTGKVAEILVPTGHAHRGQGRTMDELPGMSRGRPYA